MKTKPTQGQNLWPYRLSRYYPLPPLPSLSTWRSCWLPWPHLFLGCTAYLQPDPIPSTTSKLHLPRAIGSPRCQSQWGSFSSFHRIKSQIFDTFSIPWSPGTQIPLGLAPLRTLPMCLSHAGNSAKDFTCVFMYISPYPHGMCVRNVLSQRVTIKWVLRTYALLPSTHMGTPAPWLHCLSPSLSNPHPHLSHHTVFPGRCWPFLAFSRSQTIHPSHSFIFPQPSQPKWGKSPRGGNTLLSFHQNVNVFLLHFLFQWQHHHFYQLAWKKCESFLPWFCLSHSPPQGGPQVQ